MERADSGIRDRTDDLLQGRSRGGASHVTDGDSAGVGSRRKVRVRVKGRRRRREVTAKSIFWFLRKHGTLTQVVAVAIVSLIGALLAIEYADFVMNVSIP